MALRIGKELGVPATEVDDLEDYWVRIGLLSLQWQHTENERASKRSRRSGSPPTTSPRRKGG